MLDYGDYKAHIRKMTDNYDTISKEDLYDAFLDMTERYLTEMVSTLNYEKFIIKEHNSGTSQAQILSKPRSQRS